VNSAVRNGFTLIEVMIVVVIVAALLVVVLPAYQQQLQKGRRTDGMQALQFVASQQENFMLDRNTYTDDLEDLGLDDPYISLEEHYSVAATAGDCGNIANCYTLTATPVSGDVQERDTQCTSLILESDGEKSATGTLAAECW